MILLLLFAAGLFAGTVDAIAGGGGLISLPVLLSLGISPHIAFGTNKLQGTIGTFVATHKYYRHGLISLRQAYLGVLFGVMGGILGSVAAQLISGDILKKVVPVFLLIIFIYTFSSPKMGQQDRRPKMKESWFYLLFGFALAFYDGFLGPGTGSFWVFVLTFFLGHNLIKATAYAKIFNLNSSFIAMVCFALGGNIDYRYALMMAAGSLIGGRLGAHLAITKGAKLIRPIFLAVVSMTMVVLGYKTYAHSELYTRITGHYGLTPQILVVIIVAVGLLSLYTRINKRQKSGAA
ncbi:MAG: TSUP family transporter [Gammaproteobacteria bacterium]|nr:TSUP family transporter [Gammaproteobacteria bacterium]MCW5584116.1 TSUP family transporter [Gammaproteobacteria bacterium]